MQEFGLEDAVALATAQVAFVAKHEAIDALILKGPGATRLGVRPLRPSMDVDVLIRPKDMSKIIDSLMNRGWIERPFDTADIFPHHSTTLYHENWPCDIDVHFEFPGFEAEVSDVFEVLWTERTQFEIANCAVNIPGHSSAVLIQALHSLRAIWEPNHLADYEHLKKIEIDSDSVQDIAKKTGCLDTARPYLAFISNGENDGETSYIPSSVQWKQRQDARIPGLFRLREIVDSPWPRKANLILKAIYPSDQQLASKNINILSMSRMGKTKARLTRIGNFYRTIPQLVGSYLKHWKQ